MLSTYKQKTIKNPIQGIKPSIKITNGIVALTSLITLKKNIGKQKIANNHNKLISHFLITVLTRSCVTKHCPATLTNNVTITNRNITLKSVLINTSLFKLLKAVYCNQSAKFKTN